MPKQDPVAEFMEKFNFELNKLIVYSENTEADVDMVLNQRTKIQTMLEVQLRSSAPKP